MGSNGASRRWYCDKYYYFDKFSRVIICSLDQLNSLWVCAKTVIRLFVPPLLDHPASTGCPCLVVSSYRCPSRPVSLSSPRPLLLWQHQKRAHQYISTIHCFKVMRVFSKKSHLAKQETFCRWTLDISICKFRTKSKHINTVWQYLYLSLMLLRGCMSIACLHTGQVLLRGIRLLLEPC